MCQPGLVVVKFSSGWAALLSQPTLLPAGRTRARGLVLLRGIEAPANQPVYPAQGYSWTMKHVRDLVGSGWSPKAIQTGQPHFSKHLKCLWSTGSLPGQALACKLPCADSHKPQAMRVLMHIGQLFVFQQHKGGRWLFSCSPWFGGTGGPLLK